MVVGVGEIEGIGGAVASRFAREGLHVYVVGRTASKLSMLVAHLRAKGLSASALLSDLHDAQAIGNLFQAVQADGRTLDAVIFNAAYLNAPRRLLRTSSSFIEGNWRLTCLAGLLVGQFACKHMLENGKGTVIFTGATASLRGKPLFAAFASAKAALRSFAVNLAHELAPSGVHVAHVVIDGVVEGQRGKQAFAGLGALFMRIKGRSALIQPDEVAQTYWQLHMQPKGAWSHELEVRPFKEKF